MNKQQIFDETVNHFLTQKVPSIYDGTCVYRHPKNPSIKCAVGAFISDEEYIKRMEGVVISKFRDKGIRIPVKLQGIDMEFLERIQRIHDNLGFNKTPLNSVKAYHNLKNFAQTEGLNVTYLKSKANSFRGKAK